MKEDSEKRIQSPEQLPNHLRVTYVPTYLLAAAAALLLAAFIVWGVLGSVSDKAYYSGVVFPVQGTTDITLPNSGVVRTMLVHNGDSVHDGQAIAMVSIGNSHSFLTSTVTGLVISTKADNEPFEAFDPIVSVVDGDAFQYYESWKYPVLRELAPMMPGACPRDLADACKEHVSAEDVRDVLSFLVKAGFLKKDGEKTYSQTEQTVIGSPEALPIAIRAMHKEMANMAARAVDRYSASERHFTGVTLSVNQEARERIAKELDACCRKVLAIANEYSDQDQVCRINFQFFPVTDKIKEVRHA